MSQVIDKINAAHAANQIAQVGTAKGEAIAFANAYANNAGLPTYSHLAETLRNVKSLLNALKGNNYVERGIAQEAADDIEKLLSGIDAASIETKGT